MFQTRQGDVIVKKINWLGLAAGILTLVTLVASWYTPWWQLTIGQSLIKIDASPVNMSFGFFGSQFTIPLIWALNLITILTFTASGLIMLIYSVVPTKSYAKHLLGFSWKKPLYSVLGFAGGLVAILLVVGHFGMYLPLNGSATVTLPASIMPQGTTVSALVSATFQLPFYLAAAAGGLCVGARIYHGQVAKPAVASEPAAASAAPIAASL